MGFRASRLLGGTESLRVRVASKLPKLRRERESSTETEQHEAEPAMPEMDFEGYKFRIGAAEGEMYGSSYISKVYVEEATGDVVNDAVYSANSKVEERYNIEMTPMIYEDIFEVKKGMYAGDDVFDIITGHDINMGNASLEGIFRTQDCPI